MQPYKFVTEVNIESKDHVAKNKTAVNESDKMTTALNDDTTAIDKELILTLCFCSVLALFLVILGLCFKPKVNSIEIML